MSATVAITHRVGGIGGGRIANRLTITLDSSYNTGGEVITANACGLGRIDGLTFDGPNGGFTGQWDATNLKVQALAPAAASVSKTFGVADMTDNTDTTGFIDFAASALPIGAIPLMSKVAASAAFSGDTTATWKMGISGDLDRYSALTTNSCVTAITTSALVKNATAVQATDAARTPRLTITGTADFTSIVTAAVGAAVATLFYIPLGAVGGALSEVPSTTDLSTIVFTATAYGLP